MNYLVNIYRPNIHISAPQNALFSDRGALIIFIICETSRNYNTSLAFFLEKIRFSAVFREFFLDFFSFFLFTDYSGK